MDRERIFLDAFSWISRVHDEATVGVVGVPTSLALTQGAWKDLSFCKHATSIEDFLYGTSATRTGLELDGRCPLLGSIIENVLLTLEQEMQ